MRTLNKAVRPSLVAGEFSPEKKENPRDIKVRSFHHQDMNLYQSLHPELSVTFDFCLI